MGGDAGSTPEMRRMGAKREGLLKTACRRRFPAHEEWALVVGWAGSETVVRRERQLWGGGSAVGTARTARVLNPKLGGRGSAGGGGACDVGR